MNDAPGNTHRTRLLLAVLEVLKITLRRLSSPVLTQVIGVHWCFDYMHAMHAAEGRWAQERDDQMGSDGEVGQSRALKATWGRAATFEPRRSPSDAMRSRTSPEIGRGSNPLAVANVRLC